MSGVNWVVLPLLLVVVGALPVAQEPPDDRASFAVWLEGLKTEALALGRRPETVARALDGLEPIPSVTARDREQAEFTLTLDAYLKRRLTPAFVRTGRQMSQRHKALSSRVAAAYGVPAHVVVAVWGIESNFGRFAGVRPTVATLATLAYDSRRAAFFRKELLAALEILDAGDVDVSRLKGSWAGALGQPQFLPTTYLTTAQDFDGDGARDIWTSLADVLASIAYYLHDRGWTAGVSWGFEVADPASAADAPWAATRQEGCRAERGLTEAAPLATWRERGLKRRTGAPIAATTTEASLLRLDGRAFLVTRNYEALLKYNCAHTYALSVALLADRLARAKG